MLALILAMALQQAPIGVTAAPSPYGMVSTIPIRERPTAELEREYDALQWQIERTMDLSVLTKLNAEQAPISAELTARDVLVLRSLMRESGVTSGELIRANRQWVDAQVGRGTCKRTVWTGMRMKKLPPWCGR